MVSLLACCDPISLYGYIRTLRSECGARSAKRQCMLLPLSCTHTTAHAHQEYIQHPCRFCGKPCQIFAWKQHHARECVPFIQGVLPRKGRVFRFWGGAVIADLEPAPGRFGKDAVNPDLLSRLTDSALMPCPVDILRIIVTYTAEMRVPCSCRRARLAPSECPCRLLAEPCFSLCDCVAENPSNFVELPIPPNPKSSSSYTTLATPTTTTRIRLSPCAAAHFCVVSGLTAEQLAVPYPLACVERWGPVEEHDHEVTEEGRHGQASLGLLLTKAWSCGDCNGDGDQFFRYGKYSDVVAVI
jgi:hypothetical protein